MIELTVESVNDPRNITALDNYISKCITKSAIDNNIDAYDQCKIRTEIGFEIDKLRNPSVLLESANVDYTISAICKSINNILNRYNIRT